MRVAYVRVSTLEQNEARQIENLKAHNIEKWFIEKVSGKNTDREKLREMLGFIRAGDSVYIHDFSRLARSTKDLLDIVETLNKKGVTLVSNKESIDSSTPTGKLMLTMIAAINEFERTNLLERQAEGIAIAKVDGKYTNCGRKKVTKPANWDANYQLWKQRLITANEFMSRCGLKRTTFYKLLKEEQANE